MTHGVGLTRGIAMAVLLMAGVAAAPRHASAQDATAFIQNLGTQGLQVLGPQVPPAQRAVRFRQLFEADFDIPGIARFVLGPNARRMGPEQQQEFMNLFREYIAQTYSDKLAPFGGSPFRVSGAREMGGETVVASRVERPGGKPVELDWHVIDQGGRFLITDVFVEGVSMKVSERNRMAEILQRNGGNPQAVVAALRQELQQQRHGGYGASSPPPPSYVLPPR